MSGSILEILGRPTVHPFPARMAPGLVVEALSGVSKRGSVLDPMVGSGTVLAIARAHGLRGIGLDVDPLAVLISRVWTSTLDGRRVRAVATQVLAEAKAAAACMASKEAYPAAADEETRSFLRYWFDAGARRQLAALSEAIARVDAGAVREPLWCAFSRLIIAKQAGASRALDLSHSRPHRAFRRAPKAPFEGFLRAVERVVASCIPRGARAAGPRSSISLGDARRIELHDGSVDLVFTSPPYLNAIDYLRCSKFSLVWMGFSIGELRAIRANSIGAEVGIGKGTPGEPTLKALRITQDLPQRMRSILERYVKDTRKTIVEVARVLARDGKAVFVVGENTLRGTYIPTGDIVTHLARESGLRVLSEVSRALPSNSRYLPPPGTGKSSFDIRMRREVIIRLAKERR